MAYAFLFTRYGCSPFSKWVFQNCQFNARSDPRKLFLWDRMFGWCGGCAATSVWHVLRYLRIGVIICAEAEVTRLGDMTHIASLPPAHYNRDTIAPLTPFLPGWCIVKPCFSFSRIASLWISLGNFNISIWDFLTGLFLIYETTQVSIYNLYPMWGQPYGE